MENLKALSVKTLHVFLFISLYLFFLAEPLCLTSNFLLEIAEANLCLSTMLISVDTMLINKKTCIYHQKCFNKNLYEVDI